MSRYAVSFDSDDDDDEEALEYGQQRRRTGNGRFLENWKKEKNLGNCGAKARFYGIKVPSRLPTREDVNHYVASSSRVNTQRKPTMGLADVNVSASSLVRVIDTIDRPGHAYAEDTYARSGTYKTGLKDESGKRIPKLGAYAETGVGRARAEFSIFDAEAKGPNAAAAAEISAVGAGAMARAEIASVSASAGPVSAKLGLGVDTGASVGVDGVELKFLGTGFKLGPKTGVSIVGSEVECVIQ